MIKIQSRNKLENLSYGLSRSKWHFPRAFQREELEKLQMTKYKNTNIQNSKLQIHKNKLENQSYGLSPSKWHFPWAFRNRRIAADILSRSGLHKIRSNEIPKFFRPNLNWGFSAKCLIESICILPMLDKKKEQSVHGKKHI